jgi:hypothetical protein
MPSAERIAITRHERESAAARASEAEAPLFWWSTVTELYTVAIAATNSEPPM